MNNREAFEAWAVSHGGLDLTMHEAMDNEKLPFMCTYYNYTTEIAWRAFANKKVPVQAAIESQAQQTDSKWISVEERLPEGYKPVLVATNFGDVYTCRLPVIIAKNSKEESSVGKRERFTHWMPLPPAPEYQEPENQLDMPLPCDIRIGAGTIKKGSKLSVLVHRMNVLYQLAMKTQLGIGEPANQEPTKDE